MEKGLQAHWEDIYSRKQVEKLGWYEAHPAPSLQLIEQCEISKASRILNVGTGASTLVDELLKKGYTNLIASDLSGEALQKLQSRLGKEESEKVQWMVDDLRNPKLLNLLDPIDLWFDRAVLHFFNDESEQASYFSLLKQVLKPRGYVIIAAFNLQGAPTCSGLPVFRYDREMLQDRLGKDFELQHAFDYTYQMPSGEERAYIYTLFKRGSS
jgi:SAM-dependent methyltransferase